MCASVRAYCMYCVEPCALQYMICEREDRHGLLMSVRDKMRAVQREKIDNERETT